MQPECNTLDLLLDHRFSIIRRNGAQKVDILVRVESHEILVVNNSRLLSLSSQDFLLQTYPFPCKCRMPREGGGRFAHDGARSETSKGKGTFQQ